MTQMLYRKGKQKKVQGFMVDRLDAADDRIDDLCNKGWSRTPYECYHPKPVAPPRPEAQEENYRPKPKAKRKKSRKR